jgi:hypothetical protein
MSINILPHNEKEGLRKGYKRRVIIASLRAGFALFIVGTLLISPVYIIAHSKLNEINHKKVVNSRVSKNEDDVAGAPKLLNEKASIVMQFANSASLSERINALDRIQKSGISIKRVAYDGSKKAQSLANIILSGSASNRETLKSFEQEIRKLDFVESTSIPVSDFAKDKDLFFNMTINIANE